MSPVEYMLLIESAKHPEDIFGDVKSNKDLKSVFRSIISVIHPDTVDKTLKDRAHTCNQIFLDFYTQATTKLARGTYGDRTRSGEAAVVIKTRTTTYEVEPTPLIGLVSNTYSCLNTDANLKVARNPVDNDLLENEFKVLEDLIKLSGDMSYKAYLPKPISSFQLNSLRVNVMEKKRGLFSLVEIKRAYPDGVDGRTMVWMTSRLLSILYFTASLGYLHGCLTPKTILIDAENHGMVLSDWETSVRVGKQLSVIDKDYLSFYPTKVVDKNPVRLSLDLRMGGLSLKSITGPQVPQPLERFVTGLTLSPVEDSEQLADYFDELEELSKQLYGPKKFHKFTMP